jgi:hypothetical protein
MWPWEHLAVGYLTYSLLTRAAGRTRPSGPAVLALALGTQFPDLVDKPLAWGLGLFDSGVALGHSLLFALPVAAAALFLGRHTGHRVIATAFVVGYLSHLPMDLVYPLALGRPVSIQALLWPLGAGGGSGAVGVGTRTAALLDVFIDFLATPRGRRYLIAEVALLAGALLLWAADGRPGVPVRSPLDR